MKEVYYVYSKAPKKNNELEEVFLELKSLLDIEDFPSGCGNIPMCACGTHFVCHKLRALEQILDRFGII